jgi:putative tricarboxylic transport membrane protein
MKLNDALLGAIFLALAAVVAWQAQSMPRLSGQPFGAGTFPTVIATMMAAGGLWLIAAGLRARGVPAVAVAPWLRRPGALLRVAAVPGFVIVYALFSRQIGFPLLVPPLLAAFLWITTGRPLLSVVVAVVATAAIWLLFARLLMVPLPLGVLVRVIY